MSPYAFRMYGYASMYFTSHFTYGNLAMLMTKHESQSIEPGVKPSQNDKRMVMRNTCKS